MDKKESSKAIVKSKLSRQPTTVGPKTAASLRHAEAFPLGTPDMIGRTVEGSRGAVGVALWDEASGKLSIVAPGEIGNNLHLIASFGLNPELG